MIIIKKRSYNSNSMWEHHHRNNSPEVTEVSFGGKAYVISVVFMTQFWFNEKFHSNI